MANLDQLGLPNGSTYNFKDNTQERSDHRHYESDRIPLVHKLYESTSYYATTTSWEASSWYFISIKPDEWYKPWRVKFKVHSYCPDYINVNSYTWATVFGRADTTAFANWNERYDHAHYYTVIYPLKKAGFDAGYGHALGISILYAYNYTNSAYYRTFELDYYDCENCTVTVLDTPVHWANWTGTGTTNYSSLISMNAVDRGLQETGDANTTTENRIGYFAGKTGAKGIWANGLFMEDAYGTYQNICTGSDGTVTATSRTTDTTKIANTNGFKVCSPIWYTNTTYNANTNIGGSAVIYSSISTFDTRYSFNTTLTAGSLTAYKPLYLVGTINASDGLFYLDPVWWTQTPNDTSKIYVLVGGVYDSTTSNCRATLYEQNKWFRYDGTQLIEIANDARTLQGHDVTTSVTSSSDSLITSGAVYTSLSDKMDKANPTGTGSLSLNRASGSTVGDNSVAVGDNCEASNMYSYAEGDSTTASGRAAHAEGSSTVASGPYSHAEGSGTVASKKGAHAEGLRSEASGGYAHAEGADTVASGSDSHAEGYTTVASGGYAHAEGNNTIANHKSQHVFGEYNIADTNVASVSNRGDYVEIVGNGTADNARSNARTLDWDGNEVLAGSVTANGGFVGNLTGDASTVNGHTVNADVPSGAVFTDTTYTAGMGLSLDSDEFSLGTRWTGVSQGQTWSRLFFVTPVTNTIGTSGILSLRCTRGSVVCNATFLITSSHAGSDCATCIELSSNNYTAIRSRLVAANTGHYYFEVYDTAASIAVGTSQNWSCCFIPISGVTLTTYTSFTDGTTVPTGYTAMNDFTTTLGKAAAAIKSISRSGTTFTATRQDGSTFTFTQQDANVTQSVLSSTASAWRKVVLGLSYNSTEGATASDTTGIEYVSNYLEYQNSSGTLNSTKFRVAHAANIEYNSTTQSLDFIFS